MNDFMSAFLKASLEEFWGALSDLREVKPACILLTLPGLIVYCALLICTTIIVCILTIIGFGLSAIYTSRYAKRELPEEEESCEN